VNVVDNRQASAVRASVRAKTVAIVNTSDLQPSTGTQPAVGAMANTAAAAVAAANSAAAVASRRPGPSPTHGATGPHVVHHPGPPSPGTIFEHPSQPTVNGSLAAVTPITANGSATFADVFAAKLNSADAEKSNSFLSVKYQTSAANAACAVGTTFVSQEWRKRSQVFKGAYSTAKLHADFSADLRCHLIETHGPERASHAASTAFDVYELFSVVLRLGGIQIVTKRQQLTQVAEELNTASAVPADTIATAYVWLLGTYEVKFVTMVTREPPLIYAAVYGDVGRVAVLLGQGGEIDCIDGQGNTALHAAANNGCIAMAEHLLARDARIDVTNANGVTPLSIAVARGHALIVDLLMECGADPTIVSNQGMTSLYYAVGRNDKEVCKVLLNAGVPASQLVKPDAKLSALHLATVRDDLDIAELLMQNGAPVDAVDIQERAPLHFAAFFGNTIVALALLKNGSDPTRKTVKGHTAASIAAERGHAALSTLLAGLQNLVGT
jgi:ankyrin repeat protein